MVEARRQPFDVHAHRHKPRRDCGRRPTASCRAAARRRTFCVSPVMPMPANRQSESCCSVIVGLAALRTVRRRAISSISSLPSRASGRLARRSSPPLRRYKRGLRTVCRLAALQRLGFGQRHMVGILHAEMHHRGRQAPFPARLELLLGLGKRRALLDDRRRLDQLVDGGADFLGRHVGHAAGDLVEILPVAELAQEGDQVDAAFEDALGQEIAAEQAFAGTRIDERLRRSEFHQAIRRAERKDRRPRPAVSVWGCLAIKPC